MRSEGVFTAVLSVERAQDRPAQDRPVQDRPEQDRGVRKGEATYTGGLQKDPRGIAQLVEENIEMASKLASKFFRGRSRLGIERDEFESAAHLGLVEAANKFQAKGGSSFRTFSFFRINGAMSDLLRRAGPMSYSQFREFRKTRKEIPDSSAPVVLGVEEKEVRMLPSQNPSPEESAVLTQRVERLREAVAKLSPLEQALIRLKYVEGKSTQAFTYEGDKYSKTRVFRLHADVLRKLRELLSPMEGASV